MVGACGDGPGLMPISRYDSSYGGKQGSAGKALQAMISRYGSEKGKRVFYATANKRRRRKKRRK